MNSEIKGFDQSKMIMPQPNFSGINRQMQEHIDSINASLDEANEERWRREEAEEAFWEETLKVLKGIEQNTANLYTLVDIISKNNEQQDEIISIITEILAIAKSKNKSEAKSAYTKIMGKITQTVKDAETLAKITGYATVVWQFVQSIIDKLPS